MERTVVDHLSQSGDINIAENLLKVSHITKYVYRYSCQHVSCDSQESMSDITINKREVYVELQELLKALNEKDVLPSITFDIPIYIKFIGEICAKVVR